MKILKPETRTMKRRGGKEETVVSYPVLEEGKSAEDLSLLEEMKELSNVNRTFLANEKLEVLTGLSRGRGEAIEVIEPSLDCITSSSSSSTDIASSLSPSPTSSSSSSFLLHMDENLSESLITDMTDTSSELNSLSSHEKEVIGNNTSVDSVSVDDETRIVQNETVISKNTSQRDDKHVNPIEVEMEVEVEVEAQAEVEVEVEVENRATDSVLESTVCNIIDNSHDHTTLCEDDSSSSSSSNSSKERHEEEASIPLAIDKNGKTAHRENHPVSQVMDPNEPVYMGSKLYGKLFVFWQVRKFNFYLKIICCMML